MLWTCWSAESLTSFSTLTTACCPLTSVRRDSTARTGSVLLPGPEQVWRSPDTEAVPGRGAPYCRNSSKRAEHPGQAACCVGGKALLLCPHALFWRGPQLPSWHGTRPHTDQWHEANGEKEFHLAAR